MEQGHEVSVRLIPLRKADGKRMKKNKSNPLQKVKVPQKTPLSELSRYLRKVADPSEELNLTAHLYVLNNESGIQLPLSLTVGEIMFLTHQNDSGELRYSFLTKREDEITISSIKDIANSQKNDPQPAYFPSGMNTVDQFQLPPPEQPPQPQYQPLPPPVMIPAMDPTNSQFFTGLPFLSNSFGVSAFMPDSFTFNHIPVHGSASSNNPTSESETISLKNELENLLKSKDGGR